MNAHNLKVNTDLFQAITQKGKRAMRVAIAQNIGVGDRIKLYEVSSMGYTGKCSDVFSIVNVSKSGYPPLSAWECIISFETVIGRV